ncbi:type I-B CRISPR-associated protein Cas8b/Csh1 [Alkaliphilus hydrothermalis]|uniref:CRISPR-associated protein Csh1 n=1 Tax=Alkaliphilus hydrothermalis TaxID=1482730 RepID=A0ABS2NNI7_9FIRM|nr:type I-B CRISPR-associated protein Cas8b/Csh1 [Alkaliphilus hydrothermalis]MBM7614506.1 CRISPR-associated protein Csh1 [Alkaliphilus hydrothermalis]
MLSDVIKVFEQEYKKYGDKYITDKYIPDDGEYIIVDSKNGEFKILDRILVKKDKKTKEIDTSNPYFEFIQRADYMSKYLDSNKAIADKNIHSNNYLTFFIKKENLHNGKINNDTIEKYYEILRNPLIKYGKKSNSKKLYLSVEKKYGKPDKDRIDRIENWMKNNIFSLTSSDSKDKTYLKIFFLYDSMIYEQESERYILVNIYNSNDYNVEIEEITYGLPNDNMGLNSKKPYLENKSRKNSIPYLISSEAALIQRKFFDYLGTQVAVGKNNIYIDIEENSMNPYGNDETPGKDIHGGYYIRLKKGKEIEIIDFDVIGLYKPNINPINIDNVLELKKSNMQYHQVHSLTTLKNIINEVFFSKYLANNYFTDAKDIKINNNSLKRNLLLSRTALFAWFYKGNDSYVWKVLNASSLDLVKGSIVNGYLPKAGEQFNLRCGLKVYFEGGEPMADLLMDVKNSLRLKINKNETEKIEGDNEYYFAVGQLVSFFISLSKGRNKVHSLANPVINARTDEKIKLELKKLYKKYNYTISTGSNRFKNLFAMVAAYVPEEKVKDDLIIAGYLHSNLVYEKSE